MNRIDAAFARLRAAGQMGLFPFLTAGFPTLDATERLALAALQAGADGIELGVPFSDPLADGTTLQHASEVALRNGASLSWTIEVAARLRRETEAPIVLMPYYNPIHRYGLARFTTRAVVAGVDGVIIPDLPSGEAAPMLAAAEGTGLYLIQMVAPTTTDQRLAEVGRSARGFVYCVSLLGTTGARATLSDRLPTFMTKVRGQVRQPLLVGFGIARPEHVTGVRPYADAVVVGGAIADLLSSTPEESWVDALAAYVADLKTACTSEGSAARSEA